MGKRPGKVYLIYLFIKETKTPVRDNVRFFLYFTCDRRKILMFPLVARENKFSMLTREI